MNQRSAEIGPHRCGAEAVAADRHIHLRSDNCSPVLPEIRQAILDDMAAGPETTGGRAYDALLDEPLQSAFERLFDAPLSVAVGANGTGCNAMAIAALAARGERSRIVCHPSAHVAVWEEGAVLRLTGVPRFDVVDGPDGRIDPDALGRFLAAQPTGALNGGVLTVTDPTEVGSLYGAARIGVLAELAHAHGMKLHLDGARFAIALAALDLSAAAYSRQASIDGLSFGGTKFGALAADAVILLRPDEAASERLRRLQRASGQRMAKRRFVQVQILRLLEDDLWLRTARRENALCAAFLAAASPQIGAALCHPAETNQVFLRGDAAVSRRLNDAGIGHTLWDPNTIRLVFDHAMDPVSVRAAAARVDRVFAAG